MANLYINPRLTIPENELLVTAARSSGPGGQNVNKVNSKITLRWSPAKCQAIDPAWRRRFLVRFASRISREGVIVVHSEKFRDQPRNLADARQKLADMLLECQSAPKSRKKTRPTLGSQKRRIESKKRNSQRKQSRRPPRADD